MQISSQFDEQITGLDNMFHNIAKIKKKIDKFVHFELFFKLSLWNSFSFKIHFNMLGMQSEKKG